MSAGLHNLPNRPAVRPHHPAVLMLAAMCAGVLGDCWLPLGVGVWLGVAGALLLSWWLLYRSGSLHAAAVVLLLAAAAASAAWRCDCWRMFAGNEIGRFARSQPQPACLEVVALSSPRHSPAPPADPLRTIPLLDRSELTVRAVRIRDRDRWRSVDGKTRLSVSGELPDIRAGDKLLVFAALTRLTAPPNPGEFDFALHARSERRLCDLRCDFPQCVAVQSPGRFFSGRRVLDRLRNAGNSHLWRYVGRDEAGLAAAVLLGAREQLEQERTEAFFLTGSIHLLAISGLHVGILVSAFWFAARSGLVRRRAALIAAAAFVIGYALLTDARAPVVRAAVLVVLFCIARWTGRSTLSFNSLAVAGIGVLALNPDSLFHAGAQLSFLAVAALAYFYARAPSGEPSDPLDRLIAQSRPWPVRAARASWRFLWLMVAASMLVWIVSLPLVLYRFHLAAPSGLLLNPVLWLPVSVALFCGFGVLLFGWIAPPLAWLLGRVCDGCLAFIEACLDFALRFEGSHVWLPAPPLWSVLGFYAVLGMLAYVRAPRRWFFALFALWGAVVLISSAAQRWSENRQPQLDCTFVAVGHGTCVLVEIPGGEKLLYDSGRLGSPFAGARTVSSVLWSRGITHLDAVVISHADADHYNALPELLQRFSVGAVYVSPVMFREQSPALDALQNAVAEKSVPLRELYAGDRLRTKSDAILEVLHPTRRGVVGSDNANSIVLSIQFAGRRLLLPGDLESPGLDDVLAEEPLDCDLVMAPHHGSPRSNPRGFAGWTTPEYVIISGGDSEETAVVSQQYRQAGAQVFHTAEGGAVRARIRDGAVDVRAWRDEPWM